MTKQVFELISDATVLSDIHSLGAVIIRVKDETPIKQTEDSSLPTYLTICKCLFIYEIGDSSKAELLAGLHGILHLFSKIPVENLNFNLSRWIMDIPHIGTIIQKYITEKEATLPPQVLEILKKKEMVIRLPRGSKETARHHLCHRICTQGRLFYDSSNIRVFRDNFSTHLKKINSEWNICDENLQDN